MNETITRNVIEAAWECGVTDFVICPGGRNSSFVELLRDEKRISTTYWPEERSAAFFALGLSRKKKCPVAIVVTSGTAAGELLPAAMEAYYSGDPLLLITADRPRRFRGSGAPQTAEQAGLFGHYAKFSLDVLGGHACDLSRWTQQTPAHLNVCLEEPQGQTPYSGIRLNLHPPYSPQRKLDQSQAADIVDRFLLQTKYPLIIVSTLSYQAREAVAKLLLELNAPVYLEGISGLREDHRLQALRIKFPEKMLECAKRANYPVDGVLRIGGVPTNRIWRDIENLKNQIKVCSISQVSFSGLSWNRNVAHVEIAPFLQEYCPKKAFDENKSRQWLQQDEQYFQYMQNLFIEEPFAEPSLMNSLSLALPKNSHVYLGNSLPIREWDLAAQTLDRGFIVTASRGLNGIDGQISTFLGATLPGRDNWAVLGDLTALYDMAGLWGLSYLKLEKVSIVIMNNRGGKIFERLFPHPEMLNNHGLSFKPLADMWKMSYHCWENEPPNLLGNKQLIEIFPNDAATKRFWDRLKDTIDENSCSSWILGKAT